MAVLERHHLTEAMDATGVAWRWGLNVAHWNVLPARSFKPWTAAEESRLRLACESLGGLITDSLVRPDWSTYKPNPGSGFRVYTPSGHDTLKAGPPCVG